MPYAIAGVDMLIYMKSPDGLITEASIPNGAPVTTASLFAPGATVTSLEDGTLYRNSGTAASPVWEKVSELRITTVSLTAAQLIAMYAAPVQIIAGIPGKSIFVESYDLVMTRTSTAFTGGGVARLQYNNTANGAGTGCSATIAATVFTGAAGTTYTHRLSTDISDFAAGSVAGVGIFISNQTAAFAAGTGTAVLTVRYFVV